MNVLEWNIITGAGGLIMTVGLIAILLSGFELHKYPKKWKTELKDVYIPKLLRDNNNETNIDTVSD